MRGLRKAIKRLADPAERERLAAGVAAERERLDWGETLAGYGRLIDSVS